MSGVCKRKNWGVGHGGVPKQLLCVGVPTSWKPNLLLHLPTAPSHSVTIHGQGSGVTECRFVHRWTLASEMGTVRRGCSAVWHSARGTGVLEICLGQASITCVWLYGSECESQICGLPGQTHLVNSSCSDLLLLLLFQ